MTQSTTVVLFLGAPVSPTHRLRQNPSTRRFDSLSWQVMIAFFIINRNARCARCTADPRARFTYKKNPMDDAPADSRVHILGRSPPKSSQIIKKKM